MTQRIAAVLVLALFLLACPVSWADDLKGQIEETRRGDSGDKLGAAVHADGYTAPFYSQVLIIAKPALAGSNRTTPYYPFLDSRSSSPDALLWSTWYQHLSFAMILYQFDYNVDYNVAEECRMPPLNKYFLPFKPF